MGTENLEMTEAPKDSETTARSASAEALLNATADILCESAIIEVSLSEISRRSGVNSAMIKYYFDNKEGLLVALLEREAEKTMGALDHLMAMDISADKKLRIHISGIVNAYYRAPYLNRLVHYIVETGTPESSARITQIFIKPMTNAYRAMVAEGVEQGVIRDVDPGLLYYCLVGAADHIFHASYSIGTALGVDQVSEDLKQRYFELVSSIFMRGLSPETSAP